MSLFLVSLLLATLSFSNILSSFTALPYLSMITPSGNGFDLSGLVSIILMLTLPLLYMTLSSFGSLPEPSSFFSVFSVSLSAACPLFSLVLLSVSSSLSVTFVLMSECT